MADVNANIGVHIDTSAALAELKNLQRQLATFHQAVSKGSAASAMAQKNLQVNLLNAINATGQFTAQMGLVRTSTESFTHALEKNKLGMREYFRYAGGATRTFGRLFKQEFDTINKVAEDRVKKMQTQYIKMGRDANGAMKAMAIQPTALNMKDLATQTAIAAQRQALFNQLVKQGSTNLLNFGKNTQWAGRQLMVGFTVPLAYLGTVASKTFMDLEKQALRFRRVYGDMFTTTEDTNKAIKEIEALAQSFTKYGVAVVDTMEMAADAAAMGKVGADLTAQVAEATRLAVLGGVEQQQALETTISLTNAFGIAAEDLASKINFLNSVENQTVVSIEDLTIAIPKAGPVVQQLGGDVEDLAFFLTAMKEGGINASEGANALKSGLASLINPSKKAAAMLNDLGINIKGIVEGNAGNVRQTVIDFSRALDTLDPLNRARAIEQLFGKFQFSRLSTLFQNVTKDGTQASKVLDLATRSVEELAILSERELKAVEDSVGTNFKAAVEDLKLTLAPIGKEFLKAITPIIKVASNLLERFDGLSDGTKKFIVIATTLVGLIGPTLLMTFGLLANGAANIIKLFLTLRTGFMKLGGNSKILAEQTSYMTMEQLEAATAATSLNQAHTRLTQSFTAETAAVRALRQAYVDATRAAAQFAMANPGMMAPGYGKKGTGAFKGPKKYAGGVKNVPGPRGAGDIVPSLLSPGEAVIPADVAQSPQFKPIVSAMIDGTIQGFEGGTDEVKPFANSATFKDKIDLSGPSQGALRSNPSQVNDLVLGNPRTTETNAEFAARSEALAKRLAKNKEIRNAAISSQALTIDPTIFTPEQIARAEAAVEEDRRNSAIQIGLDGKLSDKEIARRSKPIVESEADRRAYAEAKEMQARNQMLADAEEATQLPKKKSTRMSGRLQDSHVGTGRQGVPISQVLLSPEIKASETNEKKLLVYQKILKSLGLPDEVTTQSRLMYEFPGKSNVAMQNEPGIPISQFLDEWDSLPNKWKASKISQFDSRTIDQIVYNELLEESKPKTLPDGTVIPGKTHVSDEDVRRVIEDVIPEKYPKVAESKTYRKMMVLKNSLQSFRIGAGLKSTVAETTDVLETAKKAGVIKGYTVNPTKDNDVDSKGRPITGSIYVIDNDGNEISLGRGGGGQRVTNPVGLMQEKIDEIDSEVKKNKDGTNAKNAKSLKDRENAMKAVSRNVNKSPLSKTEPETYIKQISPTTGYSFTPAPQIGGLYEKSDGTRVFVKPMEDYTAAIAEQRGTIIARDVHGLDAPVQTIKTMIDPTDVQGKRKIIVLESPYEERFNPANMTNKFTEDDYFKQLVAASLRADSDVKAGNLSGNILADVGAAGVFDSASGSRTYSENIRSMDEQVRILLGGEKGGASFFREATADIPKNMSPEEYERRVVAEIERVIPKLQKTVDTFELSPKERKVYQAMIDRLNAGKNIDWKEFHKMHSSVLVTKKESKQNVDTGEITKIKGRGKSTRVKSSSGSLADTVVTTLEPDERVVQTPKKAPRRVGKTVLPGFADAPEARTSQGIRIIDAEKQFKAEQNSLRRQLEKLEKLKVVQAKKEIKQQQKQSEMLRNLKKQEFKESINLKEQQAKADAKANRSQNRMMKMQGVGMAAGMASTAGYMTGNTNVGHALMGLSVLATIGPMLKSPTAILATTLIAAGAAALKFNHDVEKARKEGTEFAKSLSMTTAKLEELSVFTKTTPATMDADRKRQNLLSGESAVQRKFGQNILGSEFGKKLLGDIEAQASSGQSVQQIGNTLATNLSYAVIQGVATPEQARSIASALGEELGSYEIPAIVSGNLVNILGPNGENLAKDPLKVTLEIQKRSMDKQAEIFQNAINNRRDTRTLGGTAALGVGGIGTVASGLGILAGSGIGAPIAAVASIALIGKALYDQNKIKAANTKLDAAATQMGIEQIVMNNGLVDSLNEQFDLKVKAAKSEAEIQEIEKRRAKALEDLNAKNSDALDLLIAQKDELSPGAFNKGINAAIDALYKEGPMKVFADQAQALLSQGKDSKFKTMLQIELASGGLDPLTVMKLVNNPNLSTNYDVLISAQGTKDTNMLFQLLMKAGIEDEGLDVMLDVFAKDPENFDKNIQALSVLANMQQKYGITIDLNDDGVDQVQEVLDITNKLAGFTQEELSKEVFFGLGITGDLTKDEMDALWTSLVGTSASIKKDVIIDFVAAGDQNVLKAYLSAQGITTPLNIMEPKLRAKLTTKAAADLVGRQGTLNKKNLPGQKTLDEEGPGKRDTTFDDLLNDLKRTRDATINAAGGAGELLRILSGKKNITVFSGLDQQLSKLGANSDFIDWVGGIDDAIRNKLIKVAKDGKVALTELGAAAKKAFDEKQLGRFSAAAQDQINTSKAQRTSFIKLTNAGLSSADALKIIEEESLAVSIANEKNSGEIKKVVEQEQAKKKQMELTSAMTDPKTFLREINDELDRQYNLQRKLMDLSKSQTEAKISGDYIGAAILGQEQAYETSRFASEGTTDLTGKMGTLNKAMGLLGGIKDKAQRAQLQSTLSQGMSGLKQLGSFNPTFGYTPQFAGINPASAFGANPSSTTSSSSVYNIQMTVNGNNATSDDIANQVMKKINLVAQRNNKSNAVGR